MNPPRLEYSIIIPTHNRADRLRRCLDSIATLDFPQDRFEVIVVDDGGSDALEELLALYRAKLQISLFKQNHLGPAAARNLGAANASGTYLAFVDDDCRANPDWLSQLSAAFSQSPDAAIGGMTVNALEQNIYSTASQMLILFLCNYFNRDPREARFATSSNLSFPAERFREIGGFSAEFQTAGGEDRELCDRWRNHGFAIHYSTSVVVRHFHALTLRQFWRQHWIYGIGGHRFHRIRERQGQGPIRVEPIQFYTGILKFPFGKVPIPRAEAISALLALSQIANAAGFAREKFRGGRAMALAGAKAIEPRAISSER